MRSEWINIKKKHPKNMQRVWCVFTDKRQREPFLFSDALVWWRDRKGFGHWTRADCTPLESGYVVTHWHPLPPAPEEMRK